MGIKKVKLVRRTYERGREKTVSQRSRPITRRQRTRLYPEKADYSLPRPTAQKAQFRAKPQAPMPSEELLRQQARQETYLLPQQYGTTRLTLLVKDPFWIYAYWEIAQGAVESLTRHFSSEEKKATKLVLRMYDVSLLDFNGENANSYFDLEVDSGTNNWYINLWKSNVSYIGELGLRFPQGRFLALARSNSVHTPRIGYSPRSEQIWMQVKGKELASAYIRPTLIRPQTQKEPWADAVGTKKKEIRPVYYLSEEDIHAYYTNLTPLLRDIVAGGLGRLYGRYEFVLEGESRKEKETMLARLPAGYFLQKVITGASESIILLGGSEQRLQPAGRASDFTQEKLRPHQFFFELATEVVVYGRSDPQAQVWLGDKQVKLRSDGTFSLRFALGEGKLPLEFKAISSDKQASRKINTTVQRSTHYGE